MYTLILGPIIFIIILIKFGSERYYEGWNKGWDKGYEDGYASGGAQERERLIGKECLTK